MFMVLKNVPNDVDEALRHRAKAPGKAVDEIVLESIRAGLCASTELRRHDLSKSAGTWISDPEVDAALQDRIDSELWQ